MENPHTYDLAADLKNRFSHHSPPTPEAGNVLNGIRNDCNALADYLSDVCPPSRELSLATTKLEEAMFWANAAIARTWPTKDLNDAV